MNDLKNRINELEAMVVVLAKRLYKLEKPNNLRSAPDTSWFEELRKEASKIKI
jgi:hypothetical protein